MNIHLDKIIRKPYHFTFGSIVHEPILFLFSIILLNPL